MIKVKQLFFLILLVSCGRVGDKGALVTGLGDDNVTMLSLQTKGIREARCTNCHNSTASAPEPQDILNDELLIAQGWVVRGDPNLSPLYTSLWGTMPLGGPSLSHDEISLFERWIRSLAAANQGSAVIDFTPSSLDFGTVATGSEAEYSLSVRNSGQKAASGFHVLSMSSPFFFKGGSFPGLGGTCSEIFVSGLECNLMMVYRPTSAVLSQAQIQFEFQDGAESRQVSWAVQGQGAGNSIAELNFSLPRIDVGAVNLGEVQSVSIQLNNVGAAAATDIEALDLTTGFSFKGGTYPGVNGSCSSNLAPQASCTMIIEFSPTEVGLKTAALSLNYSNGSAAQTLSLQISGRGVDGSSVYYSQVRAIFNQHNCKSCHNSVSSGDLGLSFQNLRDFKKAGMDSPAVIASDLNSRLLRRISGSSELGGKMGNLSEAEIQTIASWISVGAPNDPAGSVGVLDVDPESGFNFGTLSTDQTGTQTFVLTNSGNAMIHSLLRSGLTLPFVSTEGTCTDSLAPGQSCNLVVEFSPNSAGTFTQALQLNYHNGVSEQSSQISLSGAGVGTSTAQLSINPSNHAFPPTNLMSTVHHTFSVSNLGSGSASAISVLQLAAPFSLKGSAGVFPGQGGTCSSTLAAGSSCTIILSFGPTVAGSFSKGLTLRYNNGASLQNLNFSLSGIGVSTSAPVFYSEVSAILDSYNCRSCHNNATSGVMGLTHEALRAFKKNGQTMTAVIPNDSNSRFIKRLQSDSALGNQMKSPSGVVMSSAHLGKVIAWISQGALNDPAGATAQLTVSNAPSYSFGSVVSDQKAERSFTITNTGNRAATALSRAALASPFSHIGGTCEVTLSAGSSCTMVVRFAPTSAANFASSLTVNYHNGQSSQNVSRPISGVGTGAAVAVLGLMPNPADFGSRAVNGIFELTLALSNSGGGAAGQISPAVLALPFRYKGGSFPGAGGTCGGAPAQLAAGATCTLKVEFNPLASGAFNRNLILNYNNGSSVQTISLPLTGTGFGGGAAVTFSEIKSILTSTAAGCMECHSSEWGGSAMSRALLLDFSRPVTMPRSILVSGDRSASRFLARINSTNTAFAMGGPSGGRGTLTATQRQKIVDWIMAGSPADPSGTIQQSFRPVVGDRTYITAVLYKVFGSSTANATRLRKILPRGDLFGGMCLEQDMEFVGNSNVREKSLPLPDRCADGTVTMENRLESEQVPITSPVSVATIMSSCHELASDNVNLNAALLAAGLTGASPLNDTNISKAFQRFYPGVTPSSAAVGALAAVGNKALNSSTTIQVNGTTRLQEGWRFILTTLCLSNGWLMP